MFCKFQCAELRDQYMTRAAGLVAQAQDTLSPIQQQINTLQSEVPTYIYSVTAGHSIMYLQVTIMTFLKKIVVEIAAFIT